MQDNDFEEDFNPEEHDRKMQQIFNDDYYEVNEGDQKPEFPFDPEIDDGKPSKLNARMIKHYKFRYLENWDAYTGQEAGPSTSRGNDDYDENGEYYDGPNCEDPDFIVSSPPKNLLFPAQNNILFRWIATTKKT